MQQWQGKLISGILAVVFTAVGIGSFYMLRTPDDAVKVQATVVDAVSYRNSDYDRMYKKVYEYRYRGEPYRSTDGSGQSMHPKIGGEREISIDPDDPEHIYPVGFWTWLFPLIFTLVGLGLGAALVVELMRGARGSTGDPDQPQTFRPSDAGGDGSPFV